MEKHFTASVIVIKDHKVLLLWHKKLNTWLYPGGHIEKGETPDDAAIREAKEETGLDITLNNNGFFSYLSEDVRTLTSPITIMEEKIKDSKGDHYHIDIVYLASIKDQENVTINAKESLKYGWFSLGEIQTMEIPPNLKVLLTQLLQ